MASRELGVILVLCLLVPGTVICEPQTSQDRVIVPILIYHSVRPYRPADLGGVRKFIATPDTVEQEFAYLKDNGYVSVTFDDLVARLLHGDPLPEKPVIICFDDGPETQHTYALPLLKKYSFTATFFLFTNAVGRPHYLDWAQVQELVADRMQIGCHSRFHPYLTRIDDERRLWDEIYGAKTILESHLGKPVTVYAYPFGQYNDHIVEMVKKAGYSCARGTFFGVVHSRDDLYELTGLIRTSNLKVLIAGLHALKQQSSLHMSSPRLVHG